MQGSRSEFAFTLHTCKYEHLLQINFSYQKQGKTSLCCKSTRTMWGNQATLEFCQVLWGNKKDAGFFFSFLFLSLTKQRKLFCEKVLKWKWKGAFIITLQLSWLRNSQQPLTTAFHECIQRKLLFFLPSGQTIKLQSQYAYTCRHTPPSLPLYFALLPYSYSAAPSQPHLKN